MVNIYIAKQMVKWFCRNSEAYAYLGVIQLVKSEKEDALSGVPDGIGVGQDVEKTFHSDMPSCIREVLNEFRDVFLINLPPRLPPV